MPDKTELFQISGDILQMTRGIIVHQVNCQGVMGAGLALQIRRKYPRHYADFVSRNPHLGGLVITQVNAGLYVVGIYGQDCYGGSSCHTDYDALAKGLAAVQQLSRETGLQLFIPFGIGCGLAHGDWSIVRQLILRNAPGAIVVKKEKK